MSINIGPHYRTTIAYEDGRKEVWKFSGLNAERRAVSLMNSCTRRKTEFESVTLDRMSHMGSWETLAITSREDAQA